MKQYKAFYRRNNPQLRNGGYETTRIIDASTIMSAEKKARELASRCIYGDMVFLRIEKEV